MSVTIIIGLDACSNYRQKAPAFISVVFIRLKSTTTSKNKENRVYYCLCFIIFQYGKKLTVNFLKIHKIIIVINEKTNNLTIFSTLLTLWEPNNLNNSTSIQMHIYLYDTKKNSFLLPDRPLAWIF